MKSDVLIPMDIPSEAHDFYRRALDVLREARVPFLVGGAFALAEHTGIVRFTKDFDLFVRPDDIERTLRLLATVGWQTELTFPHWLGKAYSGDYFIDFIFSSGNGVCRVDDAWFKYATPGEVLGTPVSLIPAEEMIWSKGFIQERERFDGADIAHVLRATAPRLDWRRLLDRFGPHWRVLFGHLLMFGFIYPAERDAIPAWVMEDLMQQLRQDMAAGPADAERLCQGTLLSREQYLPDLNEWGYTDARAKPLGNMGAKDIALWTAGIEPK